MREEWREWLALAYSIAAALLIYYAWRTYPPAVVEDNFAFFSGREGWRHLLERHPTQAVLAPAAALPPVAGSAEWREVHRDAVAVLLPGAFHVLRETQLPPLEAFRAHGVPMAVATDCNPGTSPLQSLRLAMALACTHFRLTPEEALRGATVNGARALGLADRGRLQPGLRADFVLFSVRYETGTRSIDAREDELGRTFTTVTQRASRTNGDITIEVGQPGNSAAIETAAIKELIVDQGNDRSYIDVVLKVMVRPNDTFDAIRARTARRSKAAQAVAQAGAVMGRCFDPAVLAGVMDLPVDELDAPLQELVDHGFLYEFSVVDPFWPSRPEIVQPVRGGISRCSRRSPRQ